MTDLFEEYHLLKEQQKKKEGVDIVDRLDKSIQDMEYGFMSALSQKWKERMLQEDMLRPSTLTEERLSFFINLLEMKEMSSKNPIDAKCWSLASAYSRRVGSVSDTDKKKLLNIAASMMVIAPSFKNDSVKQNLISIANKVYSIAGAIRESDITPIVVDNKPLLSEAAYDFLKKSEVVRSINEKISQYHLFVETLNENMKDIKKLKSELEVQEWLVDLYELLLNASNKHNDNSLIVAMIDDVLDLIRDRVVIKQEQIDEGLTEVEEEYEEETDDE